MKVFFTLLASLVVFGSFAQQPVKMLYQPGVSYTETFSDLKNWTFNSNNDGTFVTGAGAAAWRGVPVSGTGLIPNPTVVTNSTTYFVSTFNSGIQKDTTNKTIVLLATGTVDNSASTALDFFADFTNTVAGTLSFSWKSVNNFSGDRKASLRVYGSVDGVNYDELTGAQVLNFTNGTVTSGTIVNVALPASFNNSPTARLRFYCYNGTGGTNGSRPRISIDNVNITASATSACQQPAAQPVAFSLDNVTDSSIDASFTAAADPAVNSYIIVQSYNPALTSFPVNGTFYHIGSNVGDGEVIAISPNLNFSVRNLYPATNYYFYVFATHFGCPGGPLYETTAPLTGSATTLAGTNACAIPTAQPTSLSFYNITANAASGTFLASTDADEYLVIRSTSSTLSANPVKGTIYRQGDILGNGTVVVRGPATTFNATGLSPSVTYYFFVFSVKSQSCNNGPAYLTAAPLSGSFTTQALTTCSTPAAQPDALQLSASNNIIQGYFHPSASADSYLILYSTASTLTNLPQDGVTYTKGSTIGNATVLSSSSATSLLASGLTAGTDYYFYVFAANQNCTGGTKYLTANPLTGLATTSVLAVNNFYYGNLHAHSGYSDGNKDDTSRTPAFDYNFAKNSLCMDFLGISEHNHAGAGMSVSSYAPGLAQARAATTSNFLALYGMEWGVISNGGHVVVYGSDKLYGWEPNNYDVYVPVNNYIGTPSTTGTTGLFRTINTAGTNLFGTLAHPYSNDYNDLLHIPYNATADSAVVGVAVESGPAFSTDTSYNDGSYMEFLSYYTGLLAKGYHVGPTVDHDNHYTTFGRTTKARLAIIAPTLDSAGFYTAMRSRSFYATEDCEIRVSFSINNHMMGSIVAEDAAPAIAINAYDFVPATPSGTPVIKLMYGIPGSGQNAVEITRTTGSTLTFTDYNLPVLGTGYYYADITMTGNGARIVTAPIWYTKTDNTSPLKLLSLTATPLSNHTVALLWKTANEVNTDRFIIERSADGRTFSSIGAVKSNGTPEASYNFTDVFPFDGINYYRLRMTDADGSFTYSSIVAVNFTSPQINSIKVVENPVVSQVKLNITARENTIADIVITDIAGRSIYNTKAALVKGNQLITLHNTTLKAGTYFVTILFKDGRVSNKFVKL